VHDFAEISAAVVAAANLLTAAAGSWLWWRVEPATRLWVALRACQVLCGLLAISSGVLYVAGFRPDDGLFWVYVLLPVAVNFFAEQLRLVSAQTVLDARGLPDAQAVGTLPAEQQRSIVRQILRRELGVMVLAAFVTAFLLLRGYGTV
jgi:hypothetical protein